MKVHWGNNTAWCNLSRVNPKTTSVWAEVTCGMCIKMRDGDFPHNKRKPKKTGFELDPGRWLFEAMTRNGLLWRQTKGSATWDKLPPRLKDGFSKVGGELVDRIQSVLLVNMFGKTPKGERN